MIIDLCMPKDRSTKAHRGIGFITFANAAQDDDFRPVNRMLQGGGYGAYNAYISAATRYAAVGAPTLYDHPGSMYGRGPLRGMGKKIFVGRLPQEASAEDLL